MIIFRYVERKLTKYLAPFPTQTYPTIQRLVLSILRKFSPRNLSSRFLQNTQTQSFAQTRRQTLGPGGLIRNVESVYQDEFYRAAADVLGYAMDVISEWSPSGSGRIDFCFGRMKWGVELLRDGKDLNEHCCRFIPGGIYHPWIDTHLMDDWLILDCRTTAPTRRYSKYLAILLLLSILTDVLLDGDDPSPKLLRAVFDENEFDSVKIFDAKNKEIDEFVLSDDA